MSSWLTNTPLSRPALQGLPHLVAPLLLSHPQLDSEALAERLEAAADAGQLPGGAQLAGRVLQRLGAHEARCRLLLRQGLAREALLLARRQGLLAQRQALPAPAALLDAAAGGGNALLFAAAHRAVQRVGAAEQSLPLAVEARKERFPPALFDVLLAAG